MSLSVSHGAIIQDWETDSPFTDNQAWSMNSPNQDDSPHEFFPLSDPQLSVPDKNAPTAPEKPQIAATLPIEQWAPLRTKILNDFGNRISPDFHIPEPLRLRTQFWFDIYTRYGEAHHVIHHVLYPWIVYEVVDTTDLLAKGKGPRWLRRDRAQKLARTTTARIRAALVKLARRKSYEKLSAMEQDLYEKLKDVKGPRRTVFMSAARMVRSQLGQRDFFERGLINSSRYLAYMEEEFKRLDLPIELTRMPFVESSFNEAAFSKVGASGIWQIMPRTGQAYMIVNDQIDERNNPIKATTAAGRMLHSYFHALKSWPLTITSWNHGIGNIQKAIHKARSRDLPTIIDRYHQGDFKFASSNFYTCFLAALFAEKYNELAFKETPREPLQKIEIIKLAGKTRIKSLQKSSGLDAKEFIRYNMDLRGAVKRNSLLPKGLRIHLPPESKDRFNRQITARD